MDIVGSNEVVSLAGHAVANNETDLLKVGFVFLRRVMLMETRIVR
jgi:hypothetical protein